MVESIRDMNFRFYKLYNFEGNDFRCWQRKMHFLMTMLKVEYALSNPMLEVIEDEKLE